MDFPVQRKVVYTKIFTTKPRMPLKVISHATDYLPIEVAVVNSVHYTLTNSTIFPNLKLIRFSKAGPCIEVFY